MLDAVIYAASHRKDGNSDRAAQLLAQGVAEAGGTARVLTIRDFGVLPCLACGYCDTHTDHTLQNRCALAAKDQARELFSPLFNAQVVFLASPIYFYHLPSRFKTWIDRGQQFWTARMTGEKWVAGLPKRSVHPVLMAGRPTGEILFDGAMVTLKYFFMNFNISVADPLLFRGLDEPGDLSHTPNREEAIVEYAATAFAAAGS